MTGCEAVLHLAALIAIPYSYHSPDTYVDTNIKGTLNVVQAARELGVAKVIHTSTSEVYGTARFVPITEEHPLQGQSPYVANLSLSYQHPEGDTEATLLYNVAGKRISKVGLQGVPDEYEQPFGQLDFTWSRTFAENWKLRLRLRNLLDPAVEYTQGGEISRRYRKGREVAVNLEWNY